MGTEPSASRTPLWRAIGGAALALLAYLSASLVAVLMGAGSLLATAVAAAFAVGWALVWRRRALGAGSFGWVSGTSPGPPGGSGGSMKASRAWVLAGLAFAFGQSASQWYLVENSSEGWREHGETMAQVPVLAVLAFTLVVAPIGEEFLMRGSVHASLRRSMPAWLAAVLSALVFAGLHGNAVQALATVPLGVALATAYEAKQGLALPVQVHVANNLVATLLPAAAVAPLANPWAVSTAGLAFAYGCWWAWRPARAGS